MGPLQILKAESDLCEVKCFFVKDFEVLIVPPI